MTPREIDKLLVETGFDPLTMGDHRRYSTAVVQWKKLIPALTELRAFRRLHVKANAKAKAKAKAK